MKEIDSNITRFFKTNSKKYGLIFIGLCFASLACKESFVSPVKSPTLGYLVVEGVVNSGKGQTEIKLSRTNVLSNSETIYETNASIKVEGEDKTTFYLTEKVKGHYFAENLNLNSIKKYRLFVKTKEGKEYASDFQEIIKTPDIDSLNWKRTGEGVQITVNTHDESKQGLYYQWDFEETWEQTAQFKSYINYEITAINPRVNSYKVVYRNPNDNRYFDSSMYFCFQSFVSRQILLGTTAKLSKDEIHFPLNFLPNASGKLKNFYSINAKQYTLSKQAYEYFELLKKNTELTGSIFDPQPSVLMGNMLAISEPTEPVIGYISFTNIQEKRIFIDNKQLPQWGEQTTCVEKTFSNSSNIIRDQAIPSFVPTGVVPDLAPFPTIVSFYAAPRDCVDCRLKGTNVKPSYWPR